MKVNKRLTKKEKEEKRIKDMLKEKPDLILKPNHFKTDKRILRFWNSIIQGMAISDKKGWYKQKEVK